LSGGIPRTFPALDGFAWQAGYGVFTVSASEFERVREDIVDQEEHHRARSFEEEFVALLRAHGIEFGERHVWD